MLLEESKDSTETPAVRFHHKLDIDMTKDVGVACARPLDN